MKLNCWEFKNCGREENGVKVKSLGVCPVYTEMKLDSIHGGRNGGRACWVVSGSLCDGEVQGSYSEKYRKCFHCDFYNLVRQEEDVFLVSAVLLKMIR